MLDNITQKLIGLEYGWNRVGTLVVFIPGVSLITHKLKTADLRRTIENGWYDPASRINFDDARFLDNVHEWHILGSLVQTVSSIALGILVNPVFLVPSFVAMYEVVSASMSYKTHKLRLNEANGRLTLH